MRKILILSLLFALIAGSAEAKQVPWEYFLPIDEMTGKKDYGREKVTTGVDIEDNQWIAGLQLFCQTGSLLFSIGTPNPNLKLDTTSEHLIPFRVKFDNNKPFFTLWEASKNNPTRADFPSIPDYPEIDNVRKEIIKGMIKHRRLWIEFNVQSVSYIAKFDLTGFSRELAKCSKIPDTN